MPAPIVSEDEDGGELITPDGEAGGPVPAARAAFECF
jgi:hypothetical protein